MTTGWLILLLVVCSQSVDSQSTTDDGTCSDGGQIIELHQSDIERLVDTQQQQQRDIERILDSQQQLLQQYRTIMNNLS